MTSGQAVIYIQRDGFYYKENAKDAVALRFNFLPSIISDLDVLDSKTVTESITLFIQQNKLQPKECIMVISESVYFEKDYAGITREQEQPVTQLFIDSIPFENVLAKTYLIENGVKIVVTNRDLCFVVKNAFESIGFIVNAIAPIVVLDIKETDPVDTAFSLFFEKYDFLKENAFPIFLQQSKKTSQTAIKNVGTQRKSNKRTIFLIVVFLILIFILVIMLLSGHSS